MTEDSDNHGTALRHLEEAATLYTVALSDWIAVQLTDGEYIKTEAMTIALSCMAAKLIAIISTTQNRELESELLRVYEYIGRMARSARAEFAKDNPPEAS